MVGLMEMRSSVETFHSSVKYDGAEVKNTIGQRTFHQPTKPKTFTSECTEEYFNEEQKQKFQQNVNTIKLNHVY